ncbi:hypothetical protein DRE_07746 [Drechslerella stenobrocha 248]|uniref:Phosphotyrosine protein phosphatase I domain-containing protein n=1 Tax=Drechslerella stenobrocha 248 TaxID=1043628 RepID=W7HWH6_9PEZI|nr:hypothetical protein DRE_07746 [Drechslerella stenobrocha 248]
MAEAVFRQIAQENNLLDRFSIIDSAGTAAYHAGDNADARSRSVCRERGVEVNHISRQVTRADLRQFDYVLAMDGANLRDLQRMRAADAAADVRLFGEFASSVLAAKAKGEKMAAPEVEDPYYGGREGYEVNFGQCWEYSAGFMKEVLGVEVDTKQVGKTSS